MSLVIIHSTGLTTTFRWCEHRGEEENLYFHQLLLFFYHVSNNVCWHLQAINLVNEAIQTSKANIWDTFLVFLDPFCFFHPVADFIELKHSVCLHLFIFHLLNHDRMPCLHHSHLGSHSSRVQYGIYWRWFWKSMWSD